MQVYSLDIDLTERPTAEDETTVVSCEDRQSGQARLMRLAPTRQAASSGSLAQQFSLHRALSGSGLADAHDLLIKDGAVVAFTMPRIEGASLATSLGKLTPGEILAVARDAAFGAFGLHSLGYVHGDLTANNVWVARDEGGVSGCLIDLGFTTPVGTRTPTDLRGTRGFIAPESFQGSPSSSASDAFSFGKILECCTSFHCEPRLRERIVSLAALCTLDDPVRRLSDFSAIYSSLMRIARASVDPDFPHTRHFVPLRRSGMTTRQRSLRSRLGSLSEGTFVLCEGGAGSGKSELMRQTCHNLQLEGIRTIRFDEVRSVSEMLGSMESMLPWAVSKGVRAVFIETLKSFQVDKAALKEVYQFAQQLGAPIALELHQQTAQLGLPESRSLLMRPFTPRESMHATSHLLVTHSNLSAHSEALTAATGGNPGRTRAVMTDYTLSGRRSRGEPLDFERHATNEANLNAGRNSSGVLPCEATARLRRVRSSIRRRLGEYRLNRTRTAPLPLSFFGDIAEQYLALGSVRRQSRWAKRGLDAHRDVSFTPGSQNALDDYIKLVVSVLPPEERIRRFNAICEDGAILLPNHRGIIKSEIGAAYLYAKKPQMALASLREALALCKRNADDGKHQASILNRLGTAKLLSHDRGSARTYLAEASRMARAHGDWPTLTRIEGNLGLLALYSAEPATGLEYFLRHRQQTARTGRHAEYLSTLVNETICMVDLGRSRAAERRGRLAVSLSEMLSDELRLAHGYNNLGWILMMRCQGRAANDYFRLSLSIRERIGDTHGTADNYLNLARLSALARNYDEACAYLREAQLRYVALENREGEWDCRRVSARAALLREDYDEAQKQLAQIPLDSEELPEKDRADVFLMLLERFLWLGDMEGARDATARVESLQAIGRIHYLSARRMLMSGFLAMLQGDFDSSHLSCSRATEEFRRSDRGDFLLDAVTIMAALAHRTGNAPAGLRYLRYVESVTSRVREELR